MSSLVEAKAKKLVKSEARDFCTYNKRQISRVYPSGIRADSRSRFAAKFRFTEFCVRALFYGNLPEFSVICSRVWSSLGCSSLGIYVSARFRLDYTTPACADNIDATSCA